MRFGSSRLVLASSALSLATLLPACSKKSDGAAPAPAPNTSGVAEAATPPSKTAEAPAPCKVDVAPFVIDKGARGETGVTLVRLPDERYAVGYATGEGAPRAAVIVPEGTASIVDVDASKLPQLSQKPGPKARRYVHRVTPVASKELKMRVAVDLTETRPEGGRWVRCGPADEDALLGFEGTSSYDATVAEAGAPAVDGGKSAGSGPPAELRDCRSFTSRGAVWALGFEADTSGAVESRWVVATSGTPLDEQHSSLEHKAVPPEAGRGLPLPRAGQIDRYGYTLFGSTRLGDAGYLVASRYNGKLRIAKRGADWAPAGDVTDYWFGGAVGTPTLASRDTKVVVLAPLAGTLDLFGAAFALEAEPPKPQKITLAEPAGSEPVQEAERSAVSIAITSHGRIVAAFLDGKAGKRRPRLAMFDEALKPAGSAFEPLGTGDADVEDIKIAILPDDRVLVTVVVAQAGAGLAVEGAVLNCGGG